MKGKRGCVLKEVRKVLKLEVIKVECLFFVSSLERCRSMFCGIIEDCGELDRR